MKAISKDTDGEVVVTFSDLMGRAFPDLVGSGGVNPSIGIMTKTGARTSRNHFQFRPDSGIRLVVLSCPLRFFFAMKSIGMQPHAHPQLKILLNAWSSAFWEFMACTFGSSWHVRLLPL